MPDTFPRSANTAGNKPYTNPCPHRAHTHSSGEREQIYEVTEIHSGLNGGGAMEKKHRGEEMQEMVASVCTGEGEAIGRQDPSTDPKELRVS